MTTPKLSLPEITANQFQKEVTHNDALRIIEQFVQQRVKTRGTTTPVVGASDGDAYLLTAGATGVWAGRTNQIAFWKSNAWAYLTPGANDRWRVQVLDEAIWLLWSGTAYAPAPHQAAITTLTKSVAGNSNITLSEAEANSVNQIYTGVLTGSINVVAPTRSAFYVVDNRTTGSFVITFKTASGTGTTVTQGKIVAVYCDGVNILALSAPAGALRYLGVIDCSANPNYPVALSGDTYVVSVAGKIGGASGTVVEPGDWLLCKVDTAAGTQAGVGANWDVIQTNIDGAVTGPASSVSGNLASYNGVTGKIIADSGVVASGGKITLASGGTNADLSATGAATSFLRQVSVGAAITVGAILSADLATALTTPPAIGGTTPAAITASALTATGPVALSPASANVVLSPTGTGVVTINPATAGTMDNVAIGGSTPLAGAFTTGSFTGTVTVKAGTVSAPAIVSTTGTADTGPYFPGADIYAITNAGAETIRFDATNRVGIGVAPAALYDFGITSFTGTPTTGVPFALRVRALSFTDSATAGSGTIASIVFHSYGQPTLNATNSSVTSTSANNLFVAGAPIAGTNETIGTSIGFQIGSNASVAGTGTVNTALGLRVITPSGAATNYAARFDLNLLAGSQIALKSRNTAIASGVAIGGIDFQSDDTDLSAITTVAQFQARSTEAHTASALGTQFVWSTTAPTTTTLADVMWLTGNGRLGFAASPTAIVHLKAGTASASTAPLKFTSGTNLTTGEAGAMEYNGTNLFFTRSGTTREGVMVGNRGATAPSATAGVGIANYYGSSATNFLGTPNSWFSVVGDDGSVYKLPAYT